MAHAPATLTLPRCPHCEEELPTVGTFNWAAGQFVILCVFCSTCHKSLHIQIAPAAAIPVAEGPTIHQS